MLRDSVLVVAVVVVRTRPRAILLAMITMRKSIDGFPFLSHMSMGLRWAALQESGCRSSAIIAHLKLIRIHVEFLNDKRGKEKDR